VAFLVWTLLVWSGRVRNAFADATLDGSGRAGPLLLAAAFVAVHLVLAVVSIGLGVLAVRGDRCSSRSSP